MTNLSSDQRNSTVSKPVPEPMNLIITFNDGARFQFQAQVPVRLRGSDQSYRNRDADLAQWFSEQTIVPMYEFSRNGHTPEVCVSTEVTLINMANVSQIREMAQ